MELNNKPRLSPIMAIAERVSELQRRGINVINLSLGESDLDTPDYIKRAAIKAIQEGRTKYTPVDGVISLKEAIKDKLYSENKLSYNTNQILVSCGAKHSFYNFIRTVLNPDDEVILLAPYWASYIDFILLVKAKPVILKCPMNQNFKLLPEQLERAITNKTRAIFLNNPCNPTGKVYEKNELKKLAEILLKHPNILILSDEIYEHIIWEKQKIVSIASISQDLYDRTIIINGVSKSYAMTGWRIGYAAGPESVIKEMKNLQSQSTSNPSSISQAAAEAALRGDQSFTKHMVSVFFERYSTTYNSLSKLTNIKCIPSDGTFYIFPKINACCIKPLKEIRYKNISEYLLENAHVAVAPGDIFGMSNRYFRICLSKPKYILLEAIERINKSIGCLNNLITSER